MDQVTQLAKAFSTIVLDTISARELANVIQGKEGLNDIYDANMSMLRAYCEVFELNEEEIAKIGVEENIEFGLWNSAWRIAESNHFYITEL